MNTQMRHFTRNITAALAGVAILFGGASIASAADAEPQDAFMYFTVSSVSSTTTDHEEEIDLYDARWVVETQELEWSGLDNDNDGYRTGDEPESASGDGTHLGGGGGGGKVKF